VGAMPETLIAMRCHQQQFEHEAWESGETATLTAGTPNLQPVHPN
jgi:hypothetical protein